MAEYDWDLFVIGGGSGGLAASKQAVAHGAKVAVADFVKPSPPGTTWGIGGTCVNVGCIPKKLMHQAALHGDNLQDAQSYGWTFPDDDPKSIKHNWETMVNNVQAHIKSLNFGYRAELMTKQVKYFNAYAKFLDPHTVELTDKKGKVTKQTAAKFVIAIGGRPRYPSDVEGATEHCISSDDIFSMRTPPGKTLAVGAAYIALENAGFIHGCGYETTVMMRSIPLRGFDQQMAGMIVNYMEEHGVKFIKGAVPTKVEATEDGKKKVSFKFKDGTTGEDTYDTVMLAIGRDPEASKINIEATGVKVNEKNGKIPVVNEQTNVEHIYAIGDVIDSPLELTPVAIQAGKLLADRLYGGASKQMDYTNVATAVFTPIEYGAVGLSEEDAIAAYGEDNIEVYHTYFKPLEWTIPHRGDNACYCKLVCNKANSERVVGLHILGPGAGEITQGYALAIKCGATKSDFDNCVGIHPTVSEEFTTLSTTKRSGANAEKAGC